jgi:hypothetical protein
MDRAAHQKAKKTLHFQAVYMLSGLFASACERCLERWQRRHAEGPQKLEGREPLCGIRTESQKAPVDPRQAADTFFRKFSEDATQAIHDVRSNHA